MHRLISLALLRVYLRGGGRETSTDYDAPTASYAPARKSLAVIRRTASAPIRYERELPDGSVEVFAQPDGAVFPRKVFLTEWRDPHGNSMHLTWDAQLRIVAVADAVGQVTTVAYEQSGDPLKITKVTDPFGRTATFTYDSVGRLASITDLLGLTSSFRYGSGDSIDAVTTPYGTTRVTWGTDAMRRWVELTDPLGGRDRFEYGHFNTPTPEPAPAGMNAFPLTFYNNATYHWDKRAMAVAPGQPAAATTYLWGFAVAGTSSSAIIAVKRPLESRVWTNYWGASGATHEGARRLPVAIGRVLDDGTTQLTTYEYDSRGSVTKAIDPLGRETRYEYASNGLDVTAVRQKNGTAWELVDSRTYNSQHLPLTMTDAAGQTTTFTYNAAGQVLTARNAKNETTTYTYDADGRLLTITGPVAGATATFTYDALSRVRTATDSDGYTVTIDYDIAGRPTRITYPDTTYEEVTYNRLDSQSWRDRLGRITRTTYDAARRLAAVRDPAGRTVGLNWCGCSSLEALIDGNGNATKWERDVQGRVIREVRADNSDTDYAYEATTSRLKTVTDAKNQVITYSYFRDDELQQIAYTNETIATPDVNFTYDAPYGRLATMVDGTGTTTYGYHPIGQLGALRVATVDAPTANDTLTYGYDELGRIVSRGLNGVGVTWQYDALGRIMTEGTPLGTFTFTYDGATSRLATATYPNSQTSTYTYFGNAGDRRLQTIHHKYPSGATLSRFDYTYNPVGNIMTWRQQADASAVQWEYRYDSADELIAAVKKSTDPQPGVLQRFAYTYDAGDNRRSEQIDDAVTGATYDARNRLLAHSATGPLRIAGTMNEAATVTIDGQPAAVDAANAFEGRKSVVAGTNSFTIQATDASGNSASQSYQVPETGSSRTFTHDANGNLTSDGTRTFEWDAQNRLLAVMIGTHRSEFTYDGAHRRVRVVERESGLIVRDRQLLWSGFSILEERLTTGEVNRYFSAGESHNALPRFVTSDHLSSIREVTDTAGAILTRNDYDPYGRLTRVAGTQDSHFGFSRHLANSPSGLTLAVYRAYDPDAGRWISADPLGLFAGTNLFAYVSGNPIALVDRLGLCAQDPNKQGYDPQKYGPADPTDPTRPLFENEAVKNAARDAFMKTMNGTARSGLAEAGFAIQYENGKISISNLVDSVNSTEQPNMLKIKVDSNTIAIVHTHGNNAVPTPSPGDLGSRVPNFVVSRGATYVTVPGKNTYIKLPSK